MRRLFLALFLGLSLVQPTAHANLNCVSSLIGNIKALGKTKVKDLNDLGQAMSEGMLLNPHQEDVFDIYRSIFFGEFTMLNTSEPLSRVTEVVHAHPELHKPHFREFEIELEQKIYQSPDSLNQHLRSQLVNAGRVRSNLFQIDANIGIWKKMLGYEDSNNSQDKNKTKQRFYRLLDRIISPKNRALLKDDQTDYRLKIKTLFYTLKRVSTHMQARGQESVLLRQAMADLVAATGFCNRNTQLLLKSSNALDRIEGLRRITDERDSMSIELGYKGHYPELLKDINITSPSLMGKGVDEGKVFTDLQRDVYESPSEFLPNKKYRVRSLSLQESPFRSCIGGSDCSTYTYFMKAFDPSFFYFTLTDELNHSSGQATIVIGTAQDEDKNKIKVAFVDKLQNLPNPIIPPFLEAIRRAVAEDGYTLVLPEDVGDHNALSNIFATREFVAKGLLPLLKERLTGFIPHPNKYEFEGTYSRAHLKLSTKVFALKSREHSFKVTPGKAYGTHYADPRVSRHTLKDSLDSLKNSKDESEIRKYISNAQAIERTEHIPLIPIESFMEDLISIANRKDLSFETRKQAFVEVVAIDALAKRGARLKWRQVNFEEQEKRLASQEIQSWEQSSDLRKKLVYDVLARMWFDGARIFKDVNATFLQWNLLDPNIKNKTGQTALIVAVINHHVDALRNLLDDAQVNVDAKDDRGFTALDYARGLSQDDTIEMLTSLNSGPTHQSKTNTPAAVIYQQLDFATVPAGEFVRANGSRAIIDRPFEIQTTLFTQHMFVLAMNSKAGLDSHAEEGARMKINGKIELIFPNHPLSATQLDQFDDLLKRINGWAETDDPQIYKLIPSHKSGSRYDILSTDQMEYALSLARTELGSTLSELVKMRNWNMIYSHSWIAQSHGPKPVATKKPVWIGGQAVYDLVGNLRVLTKDGSPAGVSWLSGPHNFPNQDSAPGFSDVGLRLVRISP